MTKKVLYSLFCLATVALLIAPLAACNTFEGMGRDIKSAGEAMSGAARNN